jgi:ADP-ribosylglycohydrolase
MKTYIENRLRVALDGLSIGDALSMPVHWYYNRNQLNADYGWVTDYLSPRNPHPDSILWRSAYNAPNAKGEILHNQAVYWGQKNIHYHQFLTAGENTLNVQICRLLIDSINQNGAYNRDDFIQRYIAFMTTPGMHQDTYIEECHRNFFSNYANGMPPHRCGRTEKHIGGLVGIIPLILFYRKDPLHARKSAMEHLSITHPGPRMEAAGSLLIDLLLEVLSGRSLAEAIREAISHQRNPLMGHPFSRWMGAPDEWVIGTQLSTACYVEDAVPAVIYLALKYHDRPEEALVVNTNLGGDNAARGSVLGALLGASHGNEGFPDRWRNGLLATLPDLVSA